MKTACVTKGLVQAATSLVPFGDVSEDGIQWASMVRKLVLPGLGAAWKFVPAKAKLSQRLVIGVLSKKTNGIKDSSFTFCLRNLDMSTVDINWATLPLDSTDGPWKWGRKSSRRGRALVYTEREAKKFRTGPFGVQLILQYYKMELMVKSIFCD